MSILPVAVSPPKPAISPFGQPVGTPKPKGIAAAKARSVYKRRKPKIDSPADHKFRSGAGFQVEALSPVTCRVSGPSALHFTESYRREISTEGLPSNRVDRVSLDERRCLGAQGIEVVLPHEFGQSVLPFARPSTRNRTRRRSSTNSSKVRRDCLYASASIFGSEMPAPVSRSRTALTVVTRSQGLNSAKMQSGWCMLLDRRPKGGGTWSSSALTIVPFAPPIETADRARTAP